MLCYPVYEHFVFQVHSFHKLPVFTHLSTLSQYHLQRSVDLEHIFADVSWVPWHFELFKHIWQPDNACTFFIVSPHRHHSCNYWDSSQFLMMKSIWFSMHSIVCTHQMYKIDLLIVAKLPSSIHIQLSNHSALVVVLTMFTTKHPSIFAPQSQQLL